MSSSVRWCMRKIAIALSMLVALTATAQTGVCPSGSSCGVDAAAASRAAVSVTDYTLRKDVSEVRVEFKVIDRAGRVQSDLSPADFKILDNGQAVDDLTGFRHDSDLPINIAILIDCSRSTEHELPIEKQLALDFLHNFLRSGDRALIAGFNTRLLSAGGFTSDFEELEASVSELRSGGLTGFNDSVYELAARFPKASPNAARNVLVLITDGNDTVSLHTFREAYESALRNNITVYTVSVLDRRAVLPSKDLRTLSSQTAGDSFYLQHRRDLQKTFAAIDQQLRSYFVATYRADATSSAGFHKLAVELSRHDLRVQTRVGYYASN